GHQGGTDARQPGLSPCRRCADGCGECGSSLGLHRICDTLHGRRRQAVTDPGRPASGRHSDLFLVSFLILFMELACIRWFGSTVVYLTFFTNTALLAAFLGISVGCLAASHRGNLIETVLPTLLAGMTLACLVLYVFTKYSDIMIDVGGQGSPQQIFFGTEYRARD